MFPAYGARVFFLRRLEQMKKGGRRDRIMECSRVGACVRREVTREVHSCGYW